MIWYIIVPAVIVTAIIIFIVGIRTGWKLDKMKVALTAFGASIVAAVLALWQAGAPTP